MTNPGPARRRIAILGGGISGLAAAYTLAQARRAGAPIDEFLIEASGRLGGVIRTEQVEGFVVEAGPDSFLAEKPEAAALCRELGLGDSLLGSNDRQRRTYILHRSRLVPLPEGLYLFTPTRLWPIARTPLLPLRSKLAILAEWFAARPAGGPAQASKFRPPLHGRLNESGKTDDESVASFVRRHFGSGMVENIADPLLAGIFGGDSARLSVRSVLPRFYEIERKYGSLIRGVRGGNPPGRPGREPNTATGLSIQGGFARGGKPDPTAPPPLFMTLKDGLEQMISELRKRLERTRLFLGQRVIGIEPATSSPGRRYKIRCEDNVLNGADTIVLALPAFECGRLLARLDPTLGESLRAIPYTSALTVALGYDASSCENLPSGFGFLVPQKERRRFLACTFVHNKFSHRAPPGKILLRCFLGGSRDPKVLELEDDEVVSLVRRELERILNLSAKPLFHRIYRWPSSMPQYAVGHVELLRTIQTQLENHPGLYLAGNAYSGIGISDCIRTGKAAADRTLSENAQYRDKQND